MIVIENIRRKLNRLMAAIAHIKDREKRQKFVKLIDEIQDIDLKELAKLVEKPLLSYSIDGGVTIAKTNDGELKENAKTNT